MKKVSTAAVKERKNFRDHKLTIGLDLGDRSSWYCVLDEWAILPRLRSPISAWIPGRRSLPSSARNRPIFFR